MQSLLTIRAVLSTLFSPVCRVGEVRKQEGSERRSSSNVDCTMKNCQDEESVSVFFMCSLVTLTDEWAQMYNSLWNVVGFSILQLIPCHAFTVFLAFAFSNFAISSVRQGKEKKCIEETRAYAFIFSHKVFGSPLRISPIFFYKLMLQHSPFRPVSHFSDWRQIMWIEETLRFQTSASSYSLSPTKHHVLHAWSPTFSL